MTSTNKRTKDKTPTDAPRKSRKKIAPDDVTTITEEHDSNTSAKPALSATLVTGGTGFLGHHLLQALSDAKTPRVRVMTTNAPGWLRDLGVEIVEGSITNGDDVKRAVEGVKEIYHLAGHVSRRAEDAHKMYEVNVEGTRLLCEAATQAEVETIVLASSSGTLAVSESSADVANESSMPPLDIIARWGYYASKYYQERTALENFTGANRRLVIMNPSLLLGTGDERLSSTKMVLDFLARKIHVTPSGGLSFVDARDAALAFKRAMRDGKHGERYLLGAVNWSFEKLFGRLERITKTPAPRLALPSKFNVFGAKAVDALFKQWNWVSPLEPEEVEQAEHFWYFDSSKAERELGFIPRDPQETLQDTVDYVRRNFLGKSAAFAIKN